MANPFEQRLADDFYQFVKGDFDDEEVKVFICGQGLDESLAIEEQVNTNLRAYLKVNVEKQVKGCIVTLAEHKKLIDAYSRAVGEPKNPLRNSNLTDFELQLANWADVIVILPSSAGSIAELECLSSRKRLHPNC